MSITVLQLHKRASYEFKYIQDKYAINAATKTFALADGTTQSFNSEIWAEIITTKFVENPIFKSKDIISFLVKQVDEYKRVKYEFSDNPAKASLEKEKQNKGGTATFIGFQIVNETKIDIIVCGDSNLFVFNKSNVITSFPFDDFESLDSNIHFINTEQLLQEKIDETFFKQSSLEVKHDETIVVASDALSRLILKKPVTISELLKIQNFDQLHDFCLKNWENKELQEDDISAIIIPIAKMDKINYILPSDGFSFPKEVNEKFFPNSSSQNNQLNITAMELNEIKNQFNGVARDFQEVKSKQKFHEMLLMLAISLLILNIFLVYIFRPVNPKVEINEKSKKTENSKIEKSKEIFIKPKKQDIK
jgi:hypothetical protein